MSKIIRNKDFENELMEIKSKIRLLSDDLQKLNIEVNNSTLEYNKLEYVIKDVEDYAERNTERMISRRLVNAYQQLWYAIIDLDKIKGLMNYRIYFSKLEKVLYLLNEKYLNKKRNDMKFTRSNGSFEVKIYLCKKYYFTISLFNDSISFDIVNSSNKLIYSSNINIYDSNLKYYQKINVYKEYNEFEDTLLNNFETFVDNLFNIFLQMYETGDISKLMNKIKPLKDKYKNSVEDEKIVKDVLKIIMNLCKKS